MRPASGVSFIPFTEYQLTHAIHDLPCERRQPAAILAGSPFSSVGGVETAERKTKLRCPTFKGFFSWSAFVICKSPDWPGIAPIPGSPQTWGKPFAMKNPHNRRLPLYKDCQGNKFNSILENIGIADSLPPCPMPAPDSSIEFPKLNATHVMESSHTEGKKIIK